LSNIVTRSSQARGENRRWSTRQFFHQSNQ